MFWICGGSVTMCLPRVTLSFDNIGLINAQTPFTMEALQFTGRFLYLYVDNFDICWGRKLMYLIDTGLLPCAEELRSSMATLAVFADLQCGHPTWVTHLTAQPPEAEEPTEAEKLCFECCFSSLELQVDGPSRLHQFRQGLASRKKSSDPIFVDRLALSNSLDQANGVVVFQSKNVLLFVPYPKQVVDQVHKPPHAVLLDTCSPSHPAGTPVRAPSSQFGPTKFFAGRGDRAVFAYQDQMPVIIVHRQRCNELGMTALPNALLHPTTQNQVVPAPDPKTRRSTKRDCKGHVLSASLTRSAADLFL